METFSKLVKDVRNKILGSLEFLAIKNRRKNLSTSSEKDIMAIHEIMITTQNKTKNESTDTEDDQEYYSISDTTDEGSENENENEHNDTEEEFWEPPKNPVCVQLKPDVYSMPKILPESENRFKMLEVIPL